MNHTVNKKNKKNKKNKENKENKENNTFSSTPNSKEYYIEGKRDLQNILTSLSTQTDINIDDGNITSMVYELISINYLNLTARSLNWIFASLPYLSDRPKWFYKSIESALSKLALDYNSKSDSRSRRQLLYRPGNLFLIACLMLPWEEVEKHLNIKNPQCVLFEYAKSKEDLREMIKKGREFTRKCITSHSIDLNRIDLNIIHQKGHHVKYEVSAKHFTRATKYRHKKQIIEILKEFLYSDLDRVLKIFSSTNSFRRKGMRYKDRPYYKKLCYKNRKPKPEPQTVFRRNSQGKVEVVQASTCVDRMIGSLTSKE